MPLLLAILACAVCVLLPASPAGAAGCASAAESGGRQIARASSGTWIECRSGRSFGARGRLRAFAGNRFAAVGAFALPGRRTRVVLLELRRGGRGREVATLRADQRLHRLTLYRAAAYYGIAGDRPGIHALEVDDGPSGFHLSAGVSPDTLRRTGSVLSWRDRGALRRFDVRRGRHVPPASCAPPPYAANPRTLGEVTTFELELDRGYGQAGELYACVPDAKPFLVGTVSEELASSSVDLVAVDGDRGVFLRTISWKDTSYVFASFDVRAGRRLAGWTSVGYTACSASCASIDFGSIVLSRSGRIALGLSRTGDAGAVDHSVVVVDGTKMVRLDDDPAVDVHSLRVEGTTLSWLHGSERRSAPFE